MHACGRSCGAISLVVLFMFHRVGGWLYIWPSHTVLRVFPFGVCIASWSLCACINYNLSCVQLCVLGFAD